MSLLLVLMWCHRYWCCCGYGCTRMLGLTWPLTAPPPIVIVGIGATTTYTEHQTTTSKLYMKTFSAVQKPTALATGVYYSWSCLLTCCSQRLFISEKTTLQMFLIWNREDNSIHSRMNYSTGLPYIVQGWKIRGIVFAHVIRGVIHSRSCLYANG